MHSSDKLTGWILNSILLLLQWHCISTQNWTSMYITTTKPEDYWSHRECAELTPPSLDRQNFIRVCMSSIFQLHDCLWECTRGLYCNCSCKCSCSLKKAQLLMSNRVHMCSGLSVKLSKIWQCRATDHQIVWENDWAGSVCCALWNDWYEVSGSPFGKKC